MLENFCQLFQVQKSIKKVDLTKKSVKLQFPNSMSPHCTIWWRLATSYVAFKIEMIKDHVIVKIRDKSIYERLQMEAALTGRKSKRQCGDNRPLWNVDSSSDLITADALNKGKIKSDKTLHTSSNKCK